MTQIPESSSGPGRTFEVSRRAELDIENILLYTTHQWGRTQRSRYRRVLTQALRRISVHPEIGKVRDDLLPGVGSLSVHQHVVYDTLTEERVLIVRVILERQDASRELG